MFSFYCRRIETRCRSFCGRSVVDMIVVPFEIVGMSLPSCHQPIDFKMYYHHDKSLFQVVVVCMAAKSK